MVDSKPSLICFVLVFSHWHTFTGFHDTFITHTNGSIIPLNIRPKELGCQPRRVLVRSTESIKPHEQVSVIVLENLVVHMMIGRSTESNFAKNAVPRKNVFGMNQGEPARVRRSKGHVGPNVTSSDNVFRGKEWNDNHAQCIG